MKIKSNIIIYLRLRSLGCVMPFFRNKIISSLQTKF